MVAFSPLEVAIFLNPALQIVFLSIAIYYAVTIARRVGTFWAWTLLVAAFALDATRNAISLALLFALPHDQLVALVNQLGPLSVWQSLSVGTLAVIFLASGMYGLSKIFQRLQKQQGPRK